MTPARDPKQGENHEKTCFSSFFQGIVGQNPFQNLRKTRPIILNRSQPPPTLPDPFYIDFIFFNLFLQKKSLFFYVFPIFSLYFQLRRLQDQSQIVDLIFPLKPVSSRASETPKVPHSWQNNVQNVSQTNMQNSDIKNKWWLYLWNSPGGGKELLKFSQSTILLSLNTTYTRIPFLRPVNQMY